MSLVGRFEEIPAAFHFSETGLRLAERFDSAHLLGTLLFRHGYFISPWRRPITTSMPVLDECFRVCVETGNLIYAAYVAYASAWMLFEKGEPLEAVLTRLHQFAPFARNNRIAWAELMIRLQELFIAELQDGMPPAGEQTAKRALAAMNHTGHGYGIAFYHVVRQVVPYVMGRWDEALERSRETAAMWAKISSSLIDASHQFYTAMTLTALYPTADEQTRTQYRDALAEPRRKLKLWADNCPMATWPP